MRRATRWSATVMVLVACVLLAQRTGALDSSSRVRPQGTIPLQQVGEAAIEYTKTRFAVITGSPQVVLVRPISLDEVPTLGVDSIGFAGETPPLALVIVKGDFDLTKARGTSGVRGRNWHWRVKFIAYVFDLRAGAPTLTLTSPNGGRFRHVLSDPTLPDDAPLSSDRPIRHSSGDAPVPTPVEHGDRNPYGAAAPPIEIPVQGEASPNPYPGP